MTRRIITQEELKSFAHYNPEIGIFIRTRKVGRSHPVGSEIGYLKPDKKAFYRRMMYNSTFYYVHRLVFLYMTGVMPNGEVDHIDGDGLNNKWNNLRIVDASGNSRNRKLRDDNRSGYAGVYYRSSINKWGAYIINSSKDRIHIGYFRKIENAIRAREEAEKEFGYHDNHGRKQ